jgi:hypothetical protein
MQQCVVGREFLHLTHFSLELPSILEAIEFTL